MIRKIADIGELVVQGRNDPASAFARLKKLAASDSWETREVAATGMVEVGKKHPAAVLAKAREWARSADPNVRRAGSEGLRGIVKKDPKGVLPIITLLRADPSLYVKKSVANVLRNASAAHPDFVLTVCRSWAHSKNPDTQWIVKDGLRKLGASRPKDVAAILGKG